MNVTKNLHLMTDFYKKSLPTILASITTPLLGMADISVIGYLGNPSLIAGVSVGTQIFNTLYWVFGSLRFISSGNSAQSLGSGDRKARFNALCQPLTMALIVYIFLIVFRQPVLNLFLKFIHPEASVCDATGLYYSVLIFACFFVLADYIIRGWLLGQGKTVVCMIIQISCTALNVILDLAFVKYFHLGISGVAWATFIAQGIAFLLEIIYLLIFANFKRSDVDLKLLMDQKGLILFFKQNTDFLLRTVFLVIVRNTFTAYGSLLGTIPLAANAIIGQINGLMIYSLEALGTTTGIFAGKAVGEKNMEKLKELKTVVNGCTWSLAILEAVIFYVFSTPLFHVFTNIPEVLDYLNAYRFWIFLAPLFCCICDSFMGFYIGCTYSKAMRNAAFVSMLSFFVVAKFCIPVLGNHGLWMAQCTYWLVNSIILYFNFNPMCRKFEWAHT